jgi:molybdopterin molybdotransferase
MMASSLMPVDEALARILAGVKPLGSEKIRLSDGLGRVTALPLAAKRNQPPFDASAMDGFAVRANDVEDVPKTLRIIGPSAAGHSFPGNCKPGQAVRIFTGAPVPRGADAIVIQENCTINGDQVTINSPVKRGQNIRVTGLDFNKGDALIPSGTRLDPRDIGLAAAADHAMIRVRKKPVVAVLATGDELVKPGEKARSDQIVSSNSNGLLAMAEQLGARVIDGGIVKDNLKATVSAIRKLAHADILVTSGGASVGDHDYVQEALRKAGVRIDFWKIAMRPGKPFMYGRKGKAHVLGLPGNPVSALVCAELFLTPLISTMLGGPSSRPPLFAEAGADLAANDSRQDYLRGKLTVTSEARLVATPFGKQDSSMMRTFRESDCLIVRPPLSPALKKGEIVQILRLHH